MTLSFVDRSKLIFFIQRGNGCRVSGAFPIFDMLIRSGDIHDQGRKLSKIAQNVGRFFAVRNFWGRAL